MNRPMPPDETPPPVATPTVPKRRVMPLDLVGVVATGAAAALLVGGVLFAFATAGAQGVGSTDRYRLLGQAANPFIALLAVAGVLAVVAGRERRFPSQAAAAVALGVGTVVCLGVTLLAVNGILIDLTGNASGLFRFSAIVSRLGTIALAVFGLWSAAAAEPPARS